MSLVPSEHQTEFMLASLPFYALELRRCMDSDIFQRPIHFTYFAICVIITCAVIACSHFLLVPILPDTLRIRYLEIQVSEFRFTKQKGKELRS